MKKHLLIIGIVFCLAAGWRKTDILELKENISIKVANGDTARCSYHTNLHFYKCGKTLDDSINTFTVLHGLNLSVDKNKALNKTYFEALMNTNWKNFKGEFGVVNMELGSSKAYDYEKKTTSRTNFKSKKFISHVVENYYFTGGTHGHEYSVHGVFNVQNGHKVPWQELISDSAAVSQVALRKYREIQIKKGIPENVTGYFPGGIFYLSNNYYLGKKGIYFYYNTYEIGSYEEGPTTLSIPIDSIKSYIRTPWN